MRKLNGTARGAAIALFFAVVVAAPAAAAQPTRTVIYFDPGIRDLPAGTFCSFDVTSVRKLTARLTITDYSDGREASMGLTARRTYYGPTGKSFDAYTSAHEVDWLDAYPVVRGTAGGQFIWQSLPGDVGPGGVIDHLTEFYIQGSVTYVSNWETGATSQFSMTGTATDICAAIS